MFDHSHYRMLRDKLKKFNTLGQLYHSPFYATHAADIESILHQVWQQSTTTTPPVNGFIRAVQWNIERGKHLTAIVDLFKHHPVLSRADLISLNEVDIGMTRTENRNIAFDLATALDMNVAFVAEYIELTKGVGAEANLPGDNQEALHGNAILSRHPIRNLRILRLPSCFNTYQFSEKRYGDRVALIAEIDYHSQPLLMVSTHLEVRHLPSCRAKQFTAILDALSRTSLPVLIAGDLNTGTFKRGRLWHAFSAFMQLTYTDIRVMKERLRHPERYEPLFNLALEHGFDFQSYNDDLPTCFVPLTHLDEARYLPAALNRRAMASLAAHNHLLEFRLDYFFARGLKPLGNGEVEDKTSSQSPHTLANLTNNGTRISDHDPIICDFMI